MKLLLGLFLSILVIYFFSKRKIIGIILLLIIALVKFEISLGSKVFLLYQLISVPLFGIMLFYSSRIKIYKNIDRNILRAVFLYLFGLSFAAIVLRTEASFIGRIQMSLDYSMLFFLTTFCLHDLKDVEKLLKGIHFGVFVVAGIGLLGFFMGNPFLGFEELSANRYSGDYFQNLQDNDSKASLGRASFSASDPNSLGILMTFGTALSFFLIKKSNNSKYKIFYNFSVILFMVSIVLTYSRTALVIFAVLMIEKLFKYRQKIIVNVIILFVLVLVVFNIADKMGVLENLFLRLNDSEQIESGNGRASRWLYHFKQLNLEYILFGNSHTGFQGSQSKMSHTNYLALIYRGGFLTFLSFLYLLVRLFMSKLNNFIAPYRILVYIILISSISQEVVNSYGPNFVIWPIVAILAFSSKYIIRNEKNNSGFINVS